MFRLVLVGGGPNHFEVIKAIAHNPPKDKQIIMVSDRHRVFDETLLPHYLFRFLSKSQCELDLWKACQRAGILFINDSVIRLEREDQFIELEKCGKLPYDELSIECRSESVFPRMNTGSQKYIIPAKPFHVLIPRVNEFISEVKKHCPREVRVAFSGSSLWVFELALALKSRLQDICKHHEVVIFTQEDSFLYDVSRTCRKSLLAKLKTCGIRTMTGKVLESVDRHNLIFNDGSQIDVDIFIPAETFRPEQVFTRIMSAPSQKLYVNPKLQYERDEKIFVHGDCVSLFQGREEFLLNDKNEQVDVLVKNILRDQLDSPMVNYRSLQRGLQAFPLTTEKALQFWGPFAREIQKDKRTWQKEMREKIEDSRQIPLNQDLAKQQKEFEHHEDTHARKPWDSYYFRRNTNKEEQLHMVSTMGYNWWGNHVNSARYLTEVILAKALCKGIQPESIRLSAVLPKGDGAWSQHLFQSTVKSVERTAEKHGVFFSGGDTIAGDHWSLALTVAGHNVLKMKQRFRPGDYIIVTRPLGFGLLWSNRLTDGFDSKWYEQAVTSTVFPGVEPFRNFLNEFHVANAVTIEEWGFLYHCKGSIPVDQQLVVNYREIPKWDGVDTLLKLPNEIPSIDSNWSRVKEDMGFQKDEVSKLNTILWDSRSHGAIVFGVHPQQWSEAIEALKEMGFKDSTLIGCVRPKQGDGKVVLSDWVVR